MPKICAARTAANLIALERQPMLASPQAHVPQSRFPYPGALFDQRPDGAFALGGAAHALDLTTTTAMGSPSFSACYAAAMDECGGRCPIEAGVLGRLADHECRHGRLPYDPP